MEKFQARQGDIFFEAVEGLPKKSKKAGSPVIAYGEVTGHAHRMESLEGCDVYVDTEGEMYIQTKNDSSTIVHDEHGPVTFPKGTFKVTRQREYDASEAARERRVAD